MAKPPKKPDESQLLYNEQSDPSKDKDSVEKSLSSDTVSIFYDEKDDQDLLAQIAAIYQLWWHWANFELIIQSPTFAPISPVIVIPPEPIGPGNELEFVYPIHDYGNKFTTSKGEDMFIAGMSMCKMYYTIEKMIFLLIERLKSGGVSAELEVQVAFAGHELAQRKAFESVINLTYNVVVTNFDPGAWGERYLQTVKRLADKGYGYPPEAPRHNYRNLPSATPSATR